jgi:GTP-binding protein
MVVGLNARDDDLVVNVCKEKKMTNVRASNSDIAVALTPPMLMSLEEALDFLAQDEVMEVTPKNIRLRKRVLLNDERHRMSRGKARVLARR